MVSMLALAGLVVAPASQADTGIGVAPAFATVDAAVDPVVPSSAEPVIAEAVESVAAAIPAPDPLPSAEAPRVRELVGEVRAAAPPLASVPAVPASSRPTDGVAALPSSPSPPTHARHHRAASVKVAPRRSRESLSRAPAHVDRRELAITAHEPVAIPVAIPVSTGSTRRQVQQATGLQRIPEPSEPANSVDATGVIPGIFLVFLAVGMALFLARSGLGARIWLPLARPRSAALALALERPG